MLAGQLGLFVPDTTPPPLGPVEIRGEAEISACGKYRWTLRRYWHAGPYVCWIMLNPSTADAAKDDPTIREVIRRSRSWGFQGLIVVNIFPFRSSKPADCRKWFAQRQDSAEVDNALERNRDIVLEVAQGADRVIAAWGAASWCAYYADSIADQVRGFDPWGEPVRQIECLGTTQDGSPKHPLARGTHRIPRDQTPIIFEPKQEDYH